MRKNLTRAAALTALAATLGLAPAVALFSLPDRFNPPSANSWGANSWGSVDAGPSLSLDANSWG